VCEKHIDSPNSSQFVFFFVLVLEDQTGKLRAIVNDPQVLFPTFSILIYSYSFASSFMASVQQTYKGLIYLETQLVRQ